MDNLVFEESVNAEIDQSEFISKKWVYVNDTNSQNYTSQVVIDSTPLSNAGGYINWAEGFIIMPLIVQLTSATPGNLPVNTTLADHSWGFKSGFWNMINSMTVEFNNQNIVQQTPFLNVFRSFKALTSFSQDDLLNHGAELGFFPDNAGSWTFNTAVNSNGQGLANNNQAFTNVGFSPVAGANITTATPIVVPTQFAGYSAGAITAPPNPNRGLGSPYSHNEGFANRSCWYGYDPNPLLAVNLQTGQQLINGNGTCNEVFRSYKIANTGEGTVGWSICAKLRLKDLADYFAKCPLLKGSTMRFYINTNQTTITYTTVKPVIDATGVSTVGTITPLTVNVVGGLTNPLMIASNVVGNGSTPLTSDTYTLSVSIFKSSNLTSTNFQSCRLYAPVYKMNPLAEQRYLSLAPTKKILYNDIFQYQFNGIAANGTFNFLVSNGIQDIKSVLVVPFLTPTANGTAFNTLLSPFCGSGGMPDPITLTNFNIIVSGVNLFLNNELYDFEQFCEELASSNQLNGNLTTGLTSGLISQDMFSRAYRYYYGNCARILPSESGVSRSVQIQGKNASLVECNLMVFVEFQRSMVIDISTGARIE